MAITKLQNGLLEFAEVRDKILELINEAKSKKEVQLLESCLLYGDSIPNQCYRERENGTREDNYYVDCILQDLNSQIGEDYHTIASTVDISSA